MIHSHPSNPADGRHSVSAGRRSRVPVQQSAGLRLFPESLPYGPQLAGYLPHRVAKIPVLGSLHHYLISGTFDIQDILAVGCSAATAFLFGQLTKREKHDAVQS